MINIAIIGVQKSGTTSLLNYFRNSGQYDVQKSMEFVYFFNDRNDSFLFREEFEHNGKPKLIKSASLIEDRQALIRLKNLSPKVKIILLIRNPINRLESAYNFNRKKGVEIRNIDEVILESESRELFQTNSTKYLRSTNYINAGLYELKYDELLKIFPKENILFINFEKIKSDKNYLQYKLSHFLDSNLIHAELPRSNKQEDINMPPFMYRFLRNDIVKKLKNKVNKKFAQKLSQKLNAYFKVLNKKNDVYYSLNENQKSRLKILYKDSFNFIESL